MRILLCLIVATSACTSHKVVVMGSEVHAHLGELRRTGQAQVTVRTDDVESRELVRYDQEVRVDDRRPRRLDELAYRCAEQAPPREDPIPDDNQCELLTRRDDPFLLRTERRRVPLRDIGGIALASGLALGFLGGVACAIGCDSPYQEVSAVTLSALVVLALVHCVNSPGCHD